MKLLFWSVLAAGFVGCTMFGIGPVLERMGGNWLSAPMLTGSVLGLAIIALAVMFGMGVRPGVLGSDAAMVAVLGMLVAAKVVAAAISL